MAYEEKDIYLIPALLNFDIHYRQAYIFEQIYQEVYFELINENKSSPIINRIGNDIMSEYLPESSKEIKNEIKKMINEFDDKIYEETKRGTLQELVEHFNEKKPKGEFVIVVEGRK